MPFVKKVPDDIVLDTKDYITDFEALIRLLDNPNVIRDPKADKTKADVGEVIYFMRTFSGNRVVVDTRTEQSIITCCEVGKSLPESITLNDFCLLSGRDILINLFPKTTDSRGFAYYAIPTPFGVYYDPEKRCNVVVMQLCMNDEKLPDLLPTYKYVPVEESPLPDFIKKNFKFTKE